MRYMILVLAMVIYHSAIFPTTNEEPCNREITCTKKSKVDINEVELDFKDHSSKYTSEEIKIRVEEDMSERYADEAFLLKGAMSKPYPDVAKKAKSKRMIFDSRQDFNCSRSL